jgi:hypothetical protein
MSIENNEREDSNKFINHKRKNKNIDEMYTNNEKNSSSAIIYKKLHIALEVNL